MLVLTCRMGWCATYRCHGETLAEDGFVELCEHGGRSDPVLVLHQITNAEPNRLFVRKQHLLACSAQLHGTVAQPFVPAQIHTTVTRIAGSNTQESLKSVPSQGVFEDEAFCFRHSTEYLTGHGTGQHSNLLGVGVRVCLHVHRKIM